MSFIQIHELVSYPASNLNRDDLGRPKTVTIGNSTRLRISSQSLKRSWRTSSIMSEAFPELSIRTRVLSDFITKALEKGNSLFDEFNGVDNRTRQPVDPTTAKKVGEDIDNGMRSSKKSKEQDKDEDDTKNNKREKKKQVMIYSHNELAKIDDYMEKLSKGEKPEYPLPDDEHFPADIAMFGRMIADNTQYDCEAAIQVAHAFTVHKALVEDDYFTAVDELATMEGGGAAHVDVQNFGAGLYYVYICVDMDLLEKNMGSSEDAKRAVKALTEASIKVPPRGKQNSYASRAYSSYVLVEKGDQQPRSLASAFLKPVSGEDILRNAIDALRGTRSNMDTAFGNCSDASYEISIPDGKGNISELYDFLS